VYFSPTWGDVPLEPIATAFGNSLHLSEVINRSKFGVDWYGCFGFEEVNHLPLPVGTITALASDKRF